MKTVQCASASRTSARVWRRFLRACCAGLLALLGYSAVACSGTKTMYGPPEYFNDASSSSSSSAPSQESGR